LQHAGGVTVREVHVIDEDVRSASRASSRHRPPGSKTLPQRKWRRGRRVAVMHLVTFPVADAASPSRERCGTRTVLDLGGLAKTAAQRGTVRPGAAAFPKSRSI